MSGHYYTCPHCSDCLAYQIAEALRVESVLSNGKDHAAKDAQVRKLLAEYEKCKERMESR